MACNIEMARPGPVGRWASSASAAVVLLVGIVNAAVRPLWLDERATLYFTADGLAEAAVIEPQLAWFYVVIWPWLQISVEPLWIRLPFVVAMSAAAWFTVEAAREHGGDVTIAAVLVTGHIMTVRYAAEARPYAFMMLGGAGLLWSLGRDRHGAIWGLSAGIHLFGALPALFVLIERRWRAVVLAAAVSAIPALASWPPTPNVAWIPPLSGEVLVHNIYYLGGGATAILTVPAALSAVASGAPRRLAAVAFAPLVGLAMASVLHPMLVPRYLIGSVPALIIAASLRLGRSWLWPVSLLTLGSAAWLLIRW